MNLPQEILDEILSHLLSLSDGRAGLESLLKSSYRLLFANVDVYHDACDCFLGDISPINTGLLRHVRSLKYLVFRSWIDGPHRGFYELEGYLPSLRQLRALALSNTGIEQPILDNSSTCSQSSGILFPPYPSGKSRSHGRWNSFASLV